jgi:XRE family transcriptional regulator, fatty acid utilization regulator
MPPPHAEEASETSTIRIEQLANSFASAVLMPSAVLDRFGDWSSVSDSALHVRLNAVAKELQVTASALRWRLVGANRLSRLRAQAVSNALAAMGALQRDGKHPPPPLFSKAFIAVIGEALAKGLVSARRAAGLLDLTVDDLADLLRAYGLESPIDL